MRESQDSGPPTLRPRSVLLPRDQPRSLQGPVKNVGPCSKTKMSRRQQQSIKPHVVCSECRALGDHTGPTPTKPGLCSHLHWASGERSPRL